MKKAGSALNFVKREYFYYIDHKVAYLSFMSQGLLYLEETEPKNYTSCLKDDKFLVNLSKISYKPKIELFLSEFEVE